jgi:beta-galactosidase
MSRWTRREVLKSGLAASAGALVFESLPIVQSSANTESELPLANVANAQASPRERLLMDFGWRFQFGHANDAAKDFGLGLTPA